MGGYSKKCKYCERWFTTPGALAEHIRVKHLDGYVMGGYSKKCKYCERWFTTPSALAEHIRVKHMSNDKRKISTDALETLGTIIGPDEKRDAIHLAVIPIQAKYAVGPGADVAANGSPYSRPFVGIVDPFLSKVVNPGEWFWLVIYPRQITSLRHVWSHPAFPEKLQAGTVGFEYTKEQSKLWLTAWLDSSDTPLNYEQFMELLENHSVRITDYAHANIGQEYIYIMGMDAGGEISSEIWNHVENILGRRQVLRPTHFSCSLRAPVELV